MRLSRLHGRKTNDLVLRKGRVWKGRTMAIHWLPGPPRRSGKIEGPGLYVGTLASAKLHKSAVVRNRMRRRVREALRTIVRERDGLPSAQLLLRPRSASLDAPFEDIRADVLVFLTLLSRGA